MKTKHEKIKNITWAHLGSLVITWTHLGTHVTCEVQKTECFCCMGKGGIGPRYPAYFDYFCHTFVFQDLNHP